MTFTEMENREGGGSSPDFSFGCVTYKIRMRNLSGGIEQVQNSKEI